MSRQLEVLRLYRKIIRGGNHWKNGNAKINDQVINEKQYILEEARTLFRKNKDLKDDETINAKIFEGNSRFELAKHYNIPFPRMYNVPPKTFEENVGTKQVKKKRFFKINYFISLCLFELFLKDKTCLYAFTF